MDRKESNNYSHDTLCVPFSVKTLSLYYLQTEIHVLSHNYLSWGELQIERLSSTFSLQCPDGGEASKEEVKQKKDVQNRRFKIKKDMYGYKLVGPYQNKHLHFLGQTWRYIRNKFLLWLPSRCLTIPLRLLPWAAMRTLLPFLICGAITSFQKGSALAMVSLRLSQEGSWSALRSA